MSTSRRGVGCTAAVLVLACAPESTPTNQDPFATGDSSGVFTGGLLEGPAADESGGENIDGCLYGHVEGSVGVKYECSIEYDLLVTAHVDPAVGSEYDIGDFISLITSDEGSYEHPLVMACCGEEDPLPVDTCESPVYRACLSDHLSQACLAAAAMLENLSHDVPTGNGRAALAKAAMELRSDVNVCWTHFFGGTDDLDSFTQAERCEADWHDDFFEHTDFVLPGPITDTGSHVTNIRLELRSHLGPTTVVPLPGTPETCNDPRENDGEVPPLSGPGSGGGFVQPVEPIDLGVAGPTWLGEKISGTGAFGSESTMRRQVNSTALTVYELVMVENAPTTVGTSTVQASVDGFILRAQDVISAPKSGSQYVLPAGAVYFSLGATLDNQGYSVAASNSTSIRFYTVAGGVGDCPTSIASCLVNRPFSIAYEDVWGDTWELDVGQGTWAP